MLVADVAVLLGLAFSLFWAATRVNAYYFMSLEEAIADFKSIVLPADADASVIRGFANTAITVFYGAGERRTWMLVHVAAGSLLTALLAFQLLPFARTRAYRLHRFTGTFLVFPLAIVFLAQGSYVVFYKGMVELGFYVWLLDAVAVAVVVAGVLLGSAGLQLNNISLHRAGMVILASGFFLNPSQRFWWALLGKLNYGGPYESFEKFLGAPTVLSVLLAFAFNFVLAALLVLSGPNARDHKQGAVRINRLKKKAQ